MPVPAFIFVRHGEAEHNAAYHSGLGDLAFSDPKFKNALLTAKGKEQARATGETLSKRRILDIWSSPLTRCIETAEEIYEEINCAELWLHDSLMERLGGGHVCNERDQTRDIKKKFPCWRTDFLPDFPPLWLYRENFTSLQRRMLSFVLLLAEMYKNEKEGDAVVIVSHCDAICSLTHKSLKNAEFVEMTLEEILAADKASASPLQMKDLEDFEDAAVAAVAHALSLSQGGTVEAPTYQTTPAAAPLLP